MAFLGGLQGLGALAGGIQQGIGSGLNLNQYMQQQQAQNLAGNILSQAYGQANPNLFSGGQQTSTAPSQIMGGLGAVGGGAGAQPVSSQAPVPGADPGQPGTANVPNLFAQQAAPGMSPFSQQQPSLSQPPPAQPPPQAPPQGLAPFDASGRMGGGQQQMMSLPQAFQLARRVAPNADGGQLYRGVMALSQGGLVSGGAMTPYQAAQLARENNLDYWHIQNIMSETKHREAADAEARTRETRIEANNRFSQKKVQATLAFRDAQMKVLELQKQRDESAKTIQFSSDMDEDAKKKALDELNKKYEAPIAAAQKIADDALKSANEPTPSEDSGGGGQSASSDEQQSIENAKEAIKVNPAAKDQIIKKLKSMYPDANVGE